MDSRDVFKRIHGETIEVLVHNPHPRNVPERGASSYIKAAK
jgi:hypothetical protein